MKTNILINLDSLLDTRLPLVDILNPKYLEGDNNYDTRLRDNFGNISTMNFHTFYKNRNKGILRNSLPTNIHSIINQSFYLELNDLNVEDDDDFKLYVNTYPYVLTSEEESLLLDSLLLLSKYKSIEFIHRSHSEVTPKWVNDHVDIVIMYDGLQWITKHTTNKSIVDDPLVSILLVCPSLVEGYLDKPINNELFESIAKGFEPIIQLMFVDVKYFNSIK